MSSTCRRACSFINIKLSNIDDLARAILRKQRVNHSDTNENLTVQLHLNNKPSQDKTEKLRLW